MYCTYKNYFGNDSRIFLVTFSFSICFSTMKASAYKNHMWWNSLCTVTERKITPSLWEERVEILRLINFAQVHRRGLSLQRHCGRWSRILFFCRWKCKKHCLGVKCLFWNGESVRINVERSFTWSGHIVCFSINKQIFLFYSYFKALA